MSTTHHVFVYGTLLQGESNHGLVARARRLGNAVTKPGFELYDLGAYPGMVARGHSVVHGELYEVDDRTLDRIDELEGHPDLYLRTRLTLACGREVEAYLLSGEQVRRCPRVPSGDWRRREPRNGQDSLVANAG